jgi:hypothetical protein
MCHCKTCADRLHVIVVITATSVPYSLASCLVTFPFLHTCIPFTSRRFYALPIVHDTSSKNAQVSPATTSFPWRHTNTCKNHGYNAVADDSGKVSSATTWRYTNTRKNHGYNAVAEESCAGNHVVPRILHSLHKKKVKKGRKCQTFLGHTFHTVSSRRRGDVCNVGFRLVQTCGFV